MRVRSITCWSFLAFVLLCARGAYAGDVFDIIRIEHPSPSVEIVSIRQPNVKQAMSEYPSIDFAPGDSVTVAADGCVQTGGHGATWKRYVNPSGRDADHEYFGEIWIPGATGALVPIAGVVNKTLIVPTSNSNAGMFLRLGYTDDNYSDNGYYSHDSGTENQCGGSDGGPAQVTLTITHNAAATNPTGDVAPFDLFWDQIDANAIPLGARWGEQLNHVNDPASHPTGLAGDDTCSTPWQRPCTTQAPSLDTAPFVNSVVSCYWLGGPFNGHANWGPGTYTGTLAWESKSPNLDDDDYSINLTTTDDAGATEGRTQGYHIEFDSDETIDNFTSPWWHTLRQGADSPGRIPTPSEILDDHFAVVTGLIDLDCAHPCSGELHPVYALSVRALANPLYEQWGIFVRNWGDEGACSSNDHQLMLADNQYTVLLPSPPGATSVAFGNLTDFQSNNGGVTISYVGFTPGVGTELTFNLPDPGAHALVDGFLELNYTGAPAPSPPPHGPLGSVVGPGVLAPAMFARALEPDEDAFPPMNAAQLNIFRSKLPAVIYHPDTLAMKLPILTSLTSAQWRDIHARRIGGQRPVPEIRSVPDSEKAARDIARVQALYAAFGGKIPGIGPLPAGPGLNGHLSSGGASTPP